MSTATVQPLAETGFYSKLVEKRDAGHPTAGAALALLQYHWENLLKAAKDYQSVTGVAETGVELVSAQNADEFAQKLEELNVDASTVEVPNELFQRREIVAVNQRNRDEETQKLNEAKAAALQKVEEEFAPQYSQLSERFTKLTEMEKELSTSEQNWVNKFVATKLDAVSAPELEARLKSAHQSAANALKMVEEDPVLIPVSPADFPSLKELTNTGKTSTSKKSGIAKTSADLNATEATKFTPRVDDIQVNGTRLPAKTSKDGKASEPTISDLATHLKISRDNLVASIARRLEKFGVSEGDFNQPPKSVLNNDGRFHHALKINGKEYDLSWIPRSLNPDRATETSNSSATPTAAEVSIELI